MCFRENKVSQRTWLVVYCLTCAISNKYPWSKLQIISCKSSRHICGRGLRTWVHCRFPTHFRVASFPVCRHFRVGRVGKLGDRVRHKLGDRVRDKLGDRVNPYSLLNIIINLSTKDFICAINNGSRDLPWSYINI